MSAVRERNIAKIQSPYVKQQEYAEIASARKRKLLMRRLTLFLIFAAVISYFIVSAFLSQTAILEAKATQKKQLDHQLAELKKQQEIYNEEIIQLNDDDYVAKLARKNLFYSKDGEIIFNIPDDNEEKSTNH